MPVCTTWGVVGLTASHIGHVAAIVGALWTRTPTVAAVLFSNAFCSILYHVWDCKDLWSPDTPAHVVDEWRTFQALDFVTSMLAATAVLTTTFLVHDDAWVAPLTIVSIGPIGYVVAIDRFDSRLSFVVVVVCSTVAYIIWVASRRAHVWLGEDWCRSHRKRFRSPAVIASIGLLCLAFISQNKLAKENDAKYQVWHSVWHVSIGLSAFFVLFAYKIGGPNPPFFSLRAESL